MQTKAATKCLFEESDYAEVREMLVLLPMPEFRIIFLRFWATYSITQISQELGMSWDAVDRRLTVALKRLRTLYPLNRLPARSSQATAA